MLFGGTFDPVHFGHLIVSRAVAELLRADKIILIPSAVPPHKQNQSISETLDRLCMAQLAIGDDELFEVSDCELRREGPSYTIDTVRHFKEVYGPSTELFWLIGADTLEDLVNWHKVKELVNECIIVTACRPGYVQNDLNFLYEVLADYQVMLIKDHLLATPLIEISATEIRKRVAAGLSVRYQLPEAVLDYIRKRKLYQVKR